MFCSWILFLLFILCKGAEGASWRRATNSQFISCGGFVLNPSVQFSFVQRGYRIWTADKLGIDICFFLLYSASISLGFLILEINVQLDLIIFAACSVLLTVLICDDYIVSQLTSVELNCFPDAWWCQWRLFFEVPVLAALVDNMSLFRMCWELLYGSSSAKPGNLLPSHACTVASLPEHTGIKACQCKDLVVSEKASPIFVQPLLP